MIRMYHATWCNRAPYGAGPGRLASFAQSAADRLAGSVGLAGQVGFFRSVDNLKTVKMNRDRSYQDQPQQSVKPAAFIQPVRRCITPVIAAVKSRAASEVLHRALPRARLVGVVLCAKPLWEPKPWTRRGVLAQLPRKLDWRTDI